MKIMFISDIHGIKTNLEKIKSKFQELNCDKLVVLGDLYYIGPRNRMHEDYDITYVKDFLESFSNKLICMKGNCDSEVDSKISNFSIINDYSLINTDDLNIYITHGHIYNEDNWPYENSILIYGHLHIPFIKEIDTKIFINPGSISMPRKDYEASYLIYDNKEFTIYDVNDNILSQKKIK